MPRAGHVRPRRGPTDLHRGGMLGEEWVGQYDASHCAGECLYSSQHVFNSKANVEYLRQTLRDRDGQPFAVRGKDAGHFHPLEDPDDVAGWITTFLQTHYDGTS